MSARYLALLLFGLAACRADPGSYDYSEHPDIVARNSGEFLPGPTPYDPTVPRLFPVEFFYEPVGNERIYPLNGVNTFLFIFDTAGDGTGQPTLQPIPVTSSDRVQGSVSTRIVLNGLTFWGFGVFWNAPHDLSQYSTFNISMRSTNEDTETSFDEVTLSFASGAAEPSRPFLLEVPATDYGYVNDGAWHSLTIPLSDLVDAGWDPTSVRTPFAMGGLEGEFGDTLLVDDVYYQ